MGSKVYRGGATVFDALVNMGAASAKEAKEPFCSNPKCQYHDQLVPVGTEQLEVIKPGVVIGSRRRETVKRSAFVSEVNGRVAQFCEVCELAIDTAYAVMGGQELPVVQVDREPALEPGADPNEKQPRLFYYEEAENAFIPAPDLVENLVDVVHQLDEGEEVEIRFKRLDLSDVEMQNLPES